MAVIRCKKHTEYECYLVDWRPEGRKGSHPQRHIRGTEGEALAFWLDMVHMSRLARHQPVGIDPMVYELVATWRDEYKNNHLPNTVKDLNVCLVPLMGHFGKYHLSELAAPSIVEAYKTARLASKIRTRKKEGAKSGKYKPKPEAENRTVGKRTVAKELAYLSSFLRWCHDNRHIPQPIHIRNFTAKQIEPKNPIRPLHLEDISALLAAIEPEYRGILLCMTDAGLRKSEALQLRAQYVDLRRKVIIVHGKGDKLRFMPIVSTRLHKVLSEAMQTKKEGYLWLNPNTEKPYTTIKSALDRAAKNAGLDQHLYHHLMRHSFGTNAIAAGVAEKALQGMLGHVSQVTTQKYVHLAGVYYETEAKKLSSFIDPKPPRPRKKTPKPGRATDTE